MRKYLLLLVVLAVPLQIFAQSSEKDIEGIWLTKKEDMKIRIYEEKGQYIGKIDWVSENSKFEKMKGSYILKKLDYNHDNKEYENGVFLWKKGKAKCRAWLEKSNELKIVITKVGIKNTQSWTRVKG